MATLQVDKHARLLLGPDANIWLNELESEIVVDDRVSGETVQTYRLPGGAEHQEISVVYLVAPGDAPPPHIVDSGEMDGHVWWLSIDNINDVTMYDMRAEYCLYYRITVKE